MDMKRILPEENLMSRPKLMMMDEPSLGLAPVLVKELFEIIVNLNKAGYTILLSEQNARKALQCSHHGYVFETGNIVLNGKSEDLEKDIRVQHAYIGSAL